MLVKNHRYFSNVYFCALPCLLSIVKLILHSLSSTSIPQIVISLWNPKSVRMLLQKLAARLLAALRLRILYPHWNDDGWNPPQLRRIALCVSPQSVLIACCLATRHLRHGTALVRNFSANLPLHPYGCPDSMRMSGMPKTSEVRNTPVPSEERRTPRSS